MATNMSKKRKFVADGVFYAELNEVSLHTSPMLPTVGEGTTAALSFKAPQCGHV